MIGLDLIAAHLVGDYIFQTNEQAIKKLSDWRYRLAHVLTYSLPFFALGYLYAEDILKAAVFGTLVAVTHFITDSRRWASGENWPPLPILVDQAIHIATLAVLARIVA